MQPTHSPLKALLLATIFLAGNLVLPQADILFGHRLGTENETRVHLEVVGGCSNHAEHCVLARLLSDLSGQRPAAPPALHATRDASTPLPKVDRWSAPRPPLSHTHSRAPPAPLR